MDEGILLGLGNASGSFERHMKVSGMKKINQTELHWVILFGLFKYF